MSVRLDKVSSMIKDEISLIFLHKIQDPQLGLLTITNVKVTPDLRLAKVYISVYDKEKRKYCLEKVEELNGFIRSVLAKRINIKHVPELKFYIDDTLDYVEKMEGLFKKIHEDDKQDNSES